MQPRDILLLLLLGVLWAASFLFARVALGELPPLTVATLRFTLAGLVFVAMLRLSGLALPRNALEWRDFAVMGLLNNLVPFGLITLGQQHISAGMASILNSTAPLFSALLTPLFLREERFSTGRIAGVLLGIGGVALLAGPAALGMKWGAADYPALALLPGLAAALSYAFAAIWGVRFRGQPVKRVAGCQVMSAALMGLPLMLAVDHAWTFRPSAEVWLALGGLALLTTVLGYLIYFRLLLRAGPTNALLVTFIIPPAAAVMETLAFGNSLPWLALPAMALIFAGIALVDGRLWAWLRRYGKSSLKVRLARQ
jgi:drug/metabolite transporter (DMT)-like permease